MDMAKTNKTGAIITGNKMTSLGKAKAGKIVFFRILAIILTDIVVSVLYNFINSEATLQYAFHKNIQTPVSVISALLLVAAAIYLVLTIAKKIDTSAYYITPAMLTAVALYLTVTSVFFDRFTTSPILFYTMTVIASVLFAVYYIYTVLLYKK